MTELRLVGPVHPVAIKLAGPHVRQVTVPHLVRTLRKPVLGGFRNIVLVVKDAEFHARRMFREQGEVHADAVPGGAEWIGTTGPDAHGHW